MRHSNSPATFLNSKLSLGNFRGAVAKQSDSRKFPSRSTSKTGEATESNSALKKSLSLHTDVGLFKGQRRLEGGDLLHIVP